MAVDNKSSWLVDIEKRPYLLEKSNLIDLFTIATLPTITDELKQKRSIGEFVPKDQLAYEGFGSISFEEEEIQKLEQNKRIIHTTRIDSEYGKYHLNKIYTAPWKINYTVSGIREYTNVKDHPFYDELSQKEKLFIENKPFQVITLIKSPKQQQYRGYELFTDGTYTYGVDNRDTANPGYIVLCEHGKPPFWAYDMFTLQTGDIECYAGPDIRTSYGRYLTNYWIIAVPFKDRIMYINDTISIPKLESEIAYKIRDGLLTTAQGEQYLNNIYFLGSFGEMIVPVFSPKSLTTDPKIKERKKELIEKNKSKLNDPVVASQIEDELIAMDKAWLKNDPALGFYGDSGKKFNTHRKKQYVIGGVIEDFQKEKGNYEFIPNALSEGWDINSFVVIANEIRNGSYSRGIETANGGVQTKDLLRLLQNLKITGEDCHTKRTLPCIMNESIAVNMYGRYFYENGNLKEFTKDIASQYFGKQVNFRSLMYCEQKDGFCNICAGKFFANIDQDVIGVLGLELTAVFLTLSMKNMHGSKLSTMQVNDISKYFV